MNLMAALGDVLDATREKLGEIIMIVIYSLFLDMKIKIRTLEVLSVEWHFFGL